MTGPDDETAGRSRLRASHADREQVIEVLKTAFVQGRLTREEFGAQAGRALASRTYAELTAVTVGIPAGPAAAQPPRKPARVHSRRSANTGVRTGVRVSIIAAAIFAVLLLLPGKFSDNGISFLVAIGAAATMIAASALTATLMIESRRQKHPDGQLPPGAGGQGSRRSASAASAEQLPQVDHGQQHTTEAARSDRPGPQSPGSRSPRRRRDRGRRYVLARQAIDPVTANTPIWLIRTPGANGG